MIDKVREKMSEVLNLDPDIITEDSNLKDDLGLDSLDLYELVVSIEEEYDIQLPEEELLDIATVSDILTMLANHNITD
ncbi:MAG: acyl carrier protein [Lachnospiraceae bacterium]|nr:acyl carrier protein [Lachnospiraceae bacterium]